MGIRFIWIDSLCIIQDSQEDWLQETPRMTSVYGGALFNIAATLGADSDAGLWQQSATHRNIGLLVVTLEGTGFPDGEYVL